MNETETKATRLRRLTVAVILIPLLVWLVWDIYVATNEVPDDTISEIIRDWSHRLYVIPYGLGGIMGHWFVNKERDEGRPSRFKTWLLTLPLVLALSPILPPLQYMNTAFLGIGFCAGALLWPQGPRSV